MPNKSIGGAEYFIIFGCEATRYVRIYFLNRVNAEQIANSILKCLADQNKDLGVLPVRFHFDKGKGYLSQLVRNVFLKNNISSTVSCAYEHAKNGLSEKTKQC